jgi:flagellar biosynthetic protein FliP
MNRPCPWSAAIYLVFSLVVLLGAGPEGAPPRLDPAVKPATSVGANRPLPPVGEPAPAAPATTPISPTLSPFTSFDSQQLLRSASTVLLFGAISLAPAAVLMITAFVRINVVLVLLRQALGSPQVPGNQVLSALALLLTALVMRPVGETVYTQAIVPYASGRSGWQEAFREGSRPIKAFMLHQIESTGHKHYLWAIHDHSTAPDHPDPAYGDDFPLSVVATAFLLSELTAALVMGFSLYLPFLVVDLVVSAVLAAMGLFMLPPSLVAMPLKLILFVLVDGWLLVATTLLRSFGPVNG